MQSVVSNSEKDLIYLEACLVCDNVERISGQMITEEESSIRWSFSNFEKEMLDSKFVFDDRENSMSYFSCDNLMGLYSQGERQLNSIWKARFKDDSEHWLGIDVTLMADPFNDHVKAFIRVSDMTEAQEEQISLMHRAEYDSMTSLLRRDVGEARIMEYLSSGAKPGGVMIAFDLDDLKGINDTLGHVYGDKAITSIASILKSHFRKGDVLVRMGGDEFLAFLPGAAGSISSVKLALTSLLRKLAATTVGKNKERNINCSIGCAVELPETDTFDSLYQRADMALYHVKRSGKNDFAFFTPEMELANYQFRRRKTLSLQDGTPHSQQELLRLNKVLELSVASIFEYICLINVRTGRYSLYGNDGSNSHSIQPEADFDQVTRTIRDTQLPAEDRDAYYQAARLETVLAQMESPESCYSYQYALADGPREASFHWYEDNHSELLMTVRRLEAPATK